MRLCMFCNKKANTKEDAWPVWLMKRFPDSDSAYMDAERGGRKLGIWRASKPRLPVKWVCASCNSGWMSRLENRAKPVIESILDEKVTSLSVSAQAILARWSVKTVMVLEAIDPNRPWFYSEDDRQSMRASLSIPARTSVWIAKCIDQPNIYPVFRTPLEAILPIEAATRAP
jgi:hypothetical protein